MNRAQYMEHTGMGGRIILKLDIKAVGCDGIRWINLAEHREK